MGGYQLIPALKACFIVFLTICLIQLGIYEIWENQAFVDNHCSGERASSDRFIVNYCAFHRQWADWTSLKTLLHTFCFAGVWPMAITATLVVAVNEAILTGVFNFQFGSPSTPKCVEKIATVLNAGGDQ